MLQNLIELAKRQVRVPRKKLQAKYVRWRFGFRKDDLVEALAKVGILRGDAIVVHSSAAAFAGFDGRLTEVISILQEAVGPEGTLLMPTFSWLGAHLEHLLATGRIFDPAKTPSQVGVISELFRRAPGVRRSVHPTHSVAAWGKDVEWWIKDHPTSRTPCGRGSPYHKLIERHGKILLAGVGISKMSFYHCAEELLEGRMPESPFSRETYFLNCRVNDELIEMAPMRFYDPGLSGRRCLSPLEVELRKEGHWKECRTGTLALICLNATDVLAALERMTGRGEFCYVPG